MNSLIFGLKYLNNHRIEQSSILWCKLNYKSSAKSRKSDILSLLSPPNPLKGEYRAHFECFVLY